MEKTEAKFHVGQIVVMKSLKRELPFRVLGIKYDDGMWYYQWNRNNFASEGMLREQTELEKGDKK